MQVCNSKDNMNTILIIIIASIMRLCERKLQKYCWLNNILQGLLLRKINNCFVSTTVLCSLMK